MKTIILLLCLVVPTLAIAGESTNIDIIRQLEEIDKINNSMNASLNALVKERYYNCLKAFGHSAYCDCLTQNLPVAVDFRGYIKIITSTKEELQYNDLSKVDKSVIDNTFKAREKCVGTYIGTINPATK